MSTAIINKMSDDFIRAIDYAKKPLASGTVCSGISWALGINPLGGFIGGVSAELVFRVTKPAFEKLQSNPDLNEASKRLGKGAHTTLSMVIGVIVERLFTNVLLKSTVASQLVVPIIILSIFATIGLIYAGIQRYG